MTQVIKISERVPQLYLATQIKEAQALTRQGQELLAQADFIAHEAAREVLGSMGRELPRGTRPVPVRLGNGELAIRLEQESGALAGSGPKGFAKVNGKSAPAEAEPDLEVPPVNPDPLSDPSDATEESYA